MNRFKTICQKNVVEITEKKSKFIATAVPVKTREDAETILSTLKKQYKDATHNVFAYRIKETTSVWERQSDDGEPSGTAGMPILDMLRGEEIVNVLVVVTRYYGGTLLGTGGLVRAYGHSAKLALEGVIIEKTHYACLKLVVNYTLSGKVQYEITQGGYHLHDTIYTDDVTYVVYVETEAEQGLVDTLIELTGGEAVVTQGERVYGYFREGELIKEEATEQE